MSADAGAVVWLSLDPSRVESQIHRYVFKKPLLAASFILKTARIDDGDGVGANAELNAKMPLKKDYKFVIESLSRASELESLRESEPAKNKDKGWIRDVARYIGVARDLSTGAAESLGSYDRVEGSDAMLVLSPLDVVEAFAQTVRADLPLYAAQVIVGRKATQVRIDLLKKSEGRATYALAFLSTRKLLTRDEWMSLKWKEADRVEFDWHEAQRAIIAFRLKLPLFGSVEMRLER